MLLLPLLLLLLLLCLLHCFCLPPLQNAHRFFRRRRNRRRRHLVRCAGRKPGLRPAPAPLRLRPSPLRRPVVKFVAGARARAWRAPHLVRPPSAWRYISCHRPSDVPLARRFPTCSPLRRRSDSLNWLSLTASLRARASLLSAHVCRIDRRRCFHCSLVNLRSRIRRRLCQPPNSPPFRGLDHDAMRRFSAWREKGEGLPKP